MHIRHQYTRAVNCGEREWKKERDIESWNDGALGALELIAWYYEERQQHI